MLQFSPYTDPLAVRKLSDQENQQKIDNLQQAMGMIGQGVSGYQQNQRQNAMLDIQKQQAAREQSDFVQKQAEYQRQNTPQGQMPGWNQPGEGDMTMAPGISGPQTQNPLSIFQGGGMGSQSQPNTQMASAGVSDAPPMFKPTQDAQQSPQRGVLDHWDQQYPHLASGHSRTDIPGLPQGLNDAYNNPSLSRRDVADLSGRYGTGLEYQKEGAAITKSNAEAKKAEADALKAISEANGSKNTAKSDAVDAKRWDAIIKDTDPYKASSRSPLGMATIGNLKADHVIPILQNPNATNQDINASLAALDTVFQGGAATQSGIHSQEYNTIQSKLANFKTLLSSQPQAVATPEIKQHIIGLLQGLKEVNKATIKDQLDFVEAAHPDLIRKNVDAWKNVRSRIGADTPSQTQGQTITQKNKNTGQIRMSSDGGKTWQIQQ